MILEKFHPASERWFKGQFKEPTKTQIDAWRSILSGKHTLVSAPTGSGKTLAAFYVAIDRLVRKSLPDGNGNGCVQVVYVSPLKALSNDIQKNLEIPLSGISKELSLLGEPSVDISVGVRTGDTPASERQKMKRCPPDILVTTPESIYLLLTSASGRKMLSGVSSLIVDEIHALLGDKRGSHLALSIERLANLVRQNSGTNLQRIGLSATQNPIKLVANFLVGNPVKCSAADCEIIDSGFQREMDLSIEVPQSPLTAIMSNDVWREIYAQLISAIENHRTTLIFVNTRRLSERLTLALAEKLGENVVSAHHGSMSKDSRQKAEQNLKKGHLRALVATASMELGIDIGSVDLVIQLASPKNIAKFLQRVGRSGHCIDGTPKGMLFPLTRDDLVECSALLWSVN